MLIENRAKHVYIVEGITFMPGVNSVPKQAWDRINSHPGIDMRIKEGVMHIHSKDDVKDGDSDMPHHSLKEFSLSDAKKLVENTNDTSLLKAWSGDEKRSAVKAHLTTQLKKIEGDAFDGKLN
ncbi:MAG: hypothetical protein [Mu-like cryoconite phage AB09]|nr:MAG: hypothetical protein [Mu-like cryoconite phage AB09]